VYFAATAMMVNVMKTVMKITKTMCLLFGLFVLALGTFTPASLAHHGWAWTTGENMTLEGVIQDAKLGNPHGLLKVESGGTLWTVEVGQPWRNERAGLKEGDLGAGVTIRVIGEPASDPADKRIKAERLFLGDREYVLYPDRD
jgi:hypothetical protein